MGNDFWNSERLDALRAVAAEPVRVRISGACMEPRLSDGASVWVRSRRLYWPGDVLVIRSRLGGLVAHRLIGVYRRCGEWRWLTQADAAARPDCAVTRREIIGEVSGGECSPEVASVPLGHRFGAMVRLARFAINRYIRA
jgi:hypothetical protein